MEVMPGYKQTEVGVIPEDWEVKSVKQIGSPVRGGSPRPAGDPKYFNGSYIPWLTVAALTNIPSSQLVVSDTATCLTEEGSLHSRTLTAGTLIIANSGATLGVAKILGIKCCANDGIAALLNLSKCINPQYLAHFINSKTGYLREIVATGNGQPNLNTELIGNFKIPIPPTKAEQEAIAEALRDADALIESLEQLLVKKRNLKQGAMQELLTGKKRLPGFSGKWEAISLGSIADPKQRWSFTGGPFGSNLKSLDYTDVGIRIIQLQNIGDGEFKDDYEIYTSQQKADELLSCNIYPGEIILSKMGDPVARACIIPSVQKRYLMCSDGIRLAVDKSRFNTYFVFMQINAPDFRLKADNAGTGSTRKRIGLTDLKRLEILCPKLPEQTAIANILSDMDVEINVLEEKLAKACLVKQGMMQELLTGRIRLI